MRGCSGGPAGAPGTSPGAPLGATPAGAVALWQQLTAVAGALQAIRSGQSGTAALAAVDGGLRPGVQALLFQVLRQLGRADALRRQLAARTPPPAADALLCTALALGWNPDEAPYEAFTLVNQAVEAAKQGPTRAQSGFVNACLRRFLREHDGLLDDPVFVLGGDQGERLRAGVGDGKRHGEPPMDEIGGRLPLEGKPSWGR